MFFPNGHNAEAHPHGPGAPRHADGSTTMMHTHVMNRGGPGVRSPIDRWQARLRAAPSQRNMPFPVALRQGYLRAPCNDLRFCRYLWPLELGPKKRRMPTDRRKKPADAPARRAYHCEFGEQSTPIPVSQTDVRGSLADLDAVVHRHLSLRNRLNHE